MKELILTKSDEVKLGDLKLLGQEGYEGCFNKEIFIAWR